MSRVRRLNRTRFAKVKESGLPCAGRDSYQFRQPTTTEASFNLNLSFIIIGAQKAATTFVQRGLVDHPEVAIPDVELDFLIYNRTPESAGPIISSLFDGLPEASVRGIKGADYLGHPEISQELCALFPGLKLIAILRDPLDRAFSAYHHLIRYGFFPVLPPDEGLKAIFKGEWDERFPLAKQVRDYGMYGEHLQTWLKAAGQDKVLVLEQEKLLQDSEGGLRRVYRFLEIEESHKSRSLSRRSQAVTYDLRRLRWLCLAGRFRNLFERRREDGVVDGGIWNPLIQLVWIGVTAIDRMFLARLFGNRKSQVSQEVENLVADYYREDQEKLHALLGSES